MNSQNQLEGLRQVIANESLSLTERRVAADHAIQLQLAAVDAEDVPGDDAEIVELTHPWTDAKIGALMESITGWVSTKGFSLAEAKKTVMRRRRLRMLLAIVVDVAKNKQERLAACREVLSTHLHPSGNFHRNGYDESRLLDTILPSTAYKWTSTGKMRVERPPKTLADVW